MLHWIDVAIFDVAGVVRFVPDQMLPESPLPYPAFVACEPNGAKPFPFRQRSRKAAFDEPPARGEIGITRRQDGMQMIRHYDKCVDDERKAAPSPGDRISQFCDMFDQQSFSSFQQIDCEEPAGARNECATIVGHDEQDSTIITPWANPGLSR